MFNNIAKIFLPFQGSRTPKRVSYSGVTLRHERSRNHTNYDSIGVQVLNLRFRMTGNCRTFTYRFFTIRSELEVSHRGIQSKAKNLFLFLLWIDVIVSTAKDLFFFSMEGLLKNISPRLGVIRFIFQFFYKDSTPSRGCLPRQLLPTFQGGISKKEFPIPVSP